MTVSDLQRLVYRDAAPADLPGIQSLHRTAFDNDAEATLVGALNKHCDMLVSVVADLDGSIVGHVLFSPVRTEPAAGVRIVGLAPMAVQPELQLQGIGSQLVELGLTRCRDAGAAAVVVLGHTTYYPRFGFKPANLFGLRCTYDVSPDAFMAKELQKGSLSGTSGTVHYHPDFEEV